MSRDRYRHVVGIVSPYLVLDNPCMMIQRCRFRLNK